MSYTYSCSLPSGGFGSDLCQLHEQVATSSLSSYGFQGINFDSVNLIFIFSSPLSGSDVTALQTLVANFVPDGGAPSIGEKFADVIMNKSVISTTYFTCGTMFFPGTASGTSIGQIKVLTYLTSGTSPYTIRILDYTNNKTIATSTLSNTSPQYNDMGTLANLSRQPGILEIQVKVSSGTTVYVDNATVF